MTEMFIEHNGKKYPVKEPTIQTWASIMKHKDLLDETDMFVKTIELLTDIPKEELMEADPVSVYGAGEVIMTHLNTERRNIFNKIEHKGVEYDFMDINNLSFGQFVDIDTFLSKPETYKLANLHELASYFYIETGTKYGDIPANKRKEAFVDLPMKYLEGAVFFLMSSARISEQLTKIYSQSTMLKVMGKIKIILALIGGGIQQSAISVKTRFGYLIHLLLYPLLCVSITSLTLWTLIRNKKKNRKK